MQHQMTKLETWTRFGYPEADFQRHSKTFPESVCVSSFQDKEGLELFIKNNGDWKSWIMKPQRDGGLNNFFGDDIIPVVQKSKFEELKSFILQKKIDMITRTGVVTDWEYIYVREIDDEVSLYYSIFSNDNKVILQKEGGVFSIAKFNDKNEAYGDDSLYIFSKVVVTD